MFKSLFWRQLQANVERTVLTKLRARLNLFFEIFMPLYFVAILAVIQRTIPDSVVDAVNKTQTVGTLLRSDVPRSIAIVPDNDDTREFVIMMNRIAKQELNAIYFHDEEAMMNTYRENASSFASAVIFSAKLRENGSYTMYFPTEALPNIAILTGNPGDCKEVTTSTCPAVKYFTSGFVQLQTLIESTFIQIRSNVVPSFPKISLKLLPKPQALVNSKLMRSVLPIYVVLAFSPFVTYVVIAIVNEKEKRIQESMKVMGLINAVHWVSWFLVYGVFVLFLAFLTSILIDVAKILVLSNFLIIFCSLLLYGLSIITMSFMVTPFFNNAKVAGAACSLTTTIFSCLYYLTVYLNDINPAVLWLMSLLSPTALALGLDLAVRNELSGEGLSLKNICEGSFPYAATLIMLSVDVVLYALLAFYFDSVVPGEYGRKRAPWFCFLPSFWCTGKNDTTLPLSIASDNNTAEGFACLDLSPKHVIYRETVPLELQSKEAIKLIGVKKVFKRRQKEDVVAVNGVSLEIYEGQITALLGHNGAGKTTLINMLLGMIPQTEGTIRIFGLDISDHDSLLKIRRMTGICCQSDILFENLTVREHLRFYAKIKDVPFDRVKQEVDRVMDDVDLSSKENARAKSLSGGQKRKLSLAIALIGNPKMIILDEPTSGVDPCSRRHLWSLLQRIKSDKVIVLTTHHMDEADILADRKAILVKGCLRCVGSSLFLKNKFGMGYQLILVVNETPREEEIISLIQSHVAGAKKIPSRGEEIIYMLPFENVSQFPSLLLAIDEAVGAGTSNDLGIKSYGISMTSLEEVFLKLGDDDGETVLDAEESPASHKNQVRSFSCGDQAIPVFKSSANAEEDITVKKGPESFSFQLLKTNPDAQFQAFKAILKIRFLIDLRIPKNIFSVIIFPVVFACISMYLMNLPTSPSSSLELRIKPTLYQRTDGNPPLLYNYSASFEKDVNISLKNINNLGVRTQEFNEPVENLLENTPHFYFLAVEALDLHAQNLEVTASFNDTSIHALPTLMNILNNARLPSTVTAVHSPFLMLTVKTFPSSTLTSSSYSIMFGPLIFLGLIFALGPSNLVIDVIEDKENKIKHLLQINGLSFLVYWGSFFCCHISFLVVSFVSMIVIVIAFNLTMFMMPGPMICFLVTYCLFLPLGLLFFYLVSFLFKKHEQAHSVLWFFPLLIGLIPYIITVIIDVSTSSGSTLHYIFSFVFALYPAFSNLYYITKIYMIHELLKVESTISDYFCKEIVVTIVAMIFNIVFYCALIRTCDIYAMNRELMLCKKKTNATIPSSGGEIENEDDEVKAERIYIETLSSELSREIPLLINSLRKEYNPENEKRCCSGISLREKHSEGERRAAVCSLSLAVHKDDVFGLLGPNGAGKTTTLRMVASDEKPTSGKIMVGGFDPTVKSDKVYKSLGYCPQFDALWKNITLEEHLHCFAAVRGLFPEEIPHILNGYLNGLGIKEHASKRSKDLSGGTCRKLSFAISMLGNSCIVLLDEPSTGMDPQSKRFLWNTIAASFHNTNRGAILTTHSMEEADVLCTRIGIMVKGKLKCLGSSQHLKNKYGSGYLLEIQLSSDQPFQERFEDLEKLIHDMFSSYVVQEKFGTFIKVSVPQTHVGSLAKVFHNLELAKSRLGIVYYSFSQSSLEQVFLEFARLQDVE